MKRTLILICTLALSAGCIPDDRNNFMVEDSFGLTATSSIVQASVHTGSCVLGVAKNGKGQTAAKVSISLDAAEAQSALDTYNKANNTDYQILPAGLFRLDHSSLEYAVEDVVKNITVSWDAAALAEEVGTRTDLVLPVFIKSSDIQVGSGRQIVFVRMIRSELGITQKSITRVIDRTKVEPDKEGNQPQLQENIILDLKLDNSIKNVGLSYPVIIDNSLIDEYNKGQAEPFVAAPEGLVTIETPTVTIPEGGESATFKIRIDKSRLLSGGKLQAFPNYLIPITIDTKALSATRKGDPFGVDGLAYGDIVTWVAITYMEIKPGLSVSREWGYYSTASAPWSAFIDGFTAGADRNVAIDDNYVYVAETNKTRNIWAISRTDPGNVKKLPVGTVTDDGIFSVCCPRILKNTNPAINGGNDVLAVCNMTEGDPKLYVYDNGIDNDPSVLNLQTWASRRLGDTFTVWGSLQEGMLFFKDFNSAQGTVTFKLAGRTSGSLFLIGRIVAPPVTGAGAYFPFPDNISTGVASYRGGDKAWLVKASKNLWTLEGADSAPTLTELSGYFADTAYRFFELGGKRYIAYTRQVSSSDGRLFILEGEASQSWEEIILERKVVYQAAIQEEAENQEEYGSSPMSSSHSGMDLDVRTNGNDAYVAVVKQNVGLSLFRLTFND